MGIIMDTRKEDNYNLYFYSNGVMKNLYHIQDDDVLYEIESKFTETKSQTLNKVTGNFDFEHLRSINKHLLGGVYQWAGEPRKIDIFKEENGNEDSFIHWGDIEKYAENIFNNLKQDNFFDSHKGNINKIAEKLCDLYLDINYMHAFVEGNGRTQNEFIKQLALRNGYSLDMESKMQNLKREEYYSLFKEYDLTKDKSKILNELFIKNIKKIEVGHNINKINNSALFIKANNAVREKDKSKQSQSIHNDEIKIKL